MKRALAERVKQEQEAASSSSTPGSIHPKAPPSQLSAFDTNGGNGGYGMSGVSESGGMGGMPEMQGIPPPSKMIRTADNSQSMMPSSSTSSLPQDFHGGNYGTSTASSLGTYGGLNGTSVNSMGMGGSGGNMEIPRRSLPPPPISAATAPQSMETTMHQQQPPPSPRSPGGPGGKKRPRTSAIDSSNSNGNVEHSPQQTSSRRTSVSSTKNNSPETKRPSERSSGNTTAYNSQKNNSNSDDDDDNDQGSSKRTYRRSASAGAGGGQGSSKRRTKNDSSDSEDEDPSSGKFYLQHQNKALASELYAYRRRIYLLERERAYRRRECRLAEKKMREVAGIWRGMEMALGEGLGAGEFLEDMSGSGVKSENDPSIPFCTGLGSDVETTRALLLTIKDLASNNDPIPTNSNNSISSKKSKKKGEDDDDKYRKHVDGMNNFENYSRNSDASVPDDEDLMEEKSQLNEMEDLACHVANRAMKLRDGILEMMRVASNGGASGKSVTSVPLLKERIVQLEAELRGNEERLEEMAKARNEAVASERRVRRGLYRLASGRMKMEDVLKAVEKEDNGVSFMETIAMIDGMNNQKHSVSSPDGAAVVSSSDVMSSPAFSAATRTNAGESVVNGEEVAQLKKRLQDTQVIAEAREKKITELLGEREELLRRINKLLLPGLNEGDKPGADEETIRNSSLFVETATKLEISERRIQELEADAEKIRHRWAVMKGDLELAKKTIGEMEGKHERRWNELISTFSESDSASPSDDSAKAAFNSAKKIAELESKLRQSLEAVGRMETLRATLADAYKMNEILQSKIDDLKTKNAKMQAEKSAARAKEIESVTSPQASSSKKSLSENSSGSDQKLEKLKQEYRRVRKEVAAAVLSKDQAKLKQERAEKERDNLMKTNVRLLKQGSEKDDMNAKSLSTILHLKQRNEELEKENAIIKQKAQAAQQLSLAARLASNAKDRVGEEALREKELLDETVQQLRKECQLMREEKQKADVLVSQSREKINSISKDLNVARERCDELVTESNKKEEEKKRMMESLAVVKKEAVESAKKAVAAPSSSSQCGVKSEFTMEQMTTQVKYLSDRINCPVCNSREKKCILLRCRHMFCRNCVDENIKNRSRKCPACAQRFDTKDVGEIWL